MIPWGLFSEVRPSPLGPRPLIRVLTAASWVFLLVRKGRTGSLLHVTSENYILFWSHSSVYFHCFASSHHWHLERRMRRKRKGRKKKKRRLPLPCLHTSKDLLMSLPIVWAPCLHLSFAIYTPREITENRRSLSQQDRTASSTSYSRIKEVIVIGI